MSYSDVENKIMKDGKLKTRESIKNDPVALGIRDAFDRINPKFSTYDEEGKDAAVAATKGKALGENMKDFFTVGRDMDSMHDAVTGGAASKDTLVGITKDMLGVLKEISGKMGPETNLDKIKK